MIDNNIKRFAQLISEINDINKELDNERCDFYDGGTPFEICNEYKINELVKLQNEFVELGNLIFKNN